MTLGPAPTRRLPRLSLLAIAVFAAIVLAGAGPRAAAAAEPAASPTPTPVATPEATPTPSPTPAPAATPTPTPDATPSPTPAATPTPTPEASPTPTPAPTPTIERVLLYRRSAIVPQYTSYWCVPAATQTMLNLARGTSDRTYATQRRYYRGTRTHNRYTYRTRGNDPQGWAWALRYYSKGSTTYQARAFTNKTRALYAIAESIARTGDPVGVPVRNGTHAWVVLGYKMQVDAVDPAKRKLLGFYVSGPLRNGRDPWRYEYMSIANFRKVFSMYHEWQRRVIWEDKWVIISQ
jgi:hypothetical protein